MLLNHPLPLPSLVSLALIQNHQKSHSIYNFKIGAAVKANATAGFLYINTDKKVSTASMVFTSYNCANSGKFVISQQNNNLVHAPTAIEVQLTGGGRQKQAQPSATLGVSVYWCHDTSVI